MTKKSTTTATASTASNSALPVMNLEQAVATLTAAKAAMEEEITPEAEAAFDELADHNTPAMELARIDLSKKLTTAQKIAALLEEAKASGEDVSKIEKAITRGTSPRKANVWDASIIKAMKLRSRLDTIMEKIEEFNTFAKESGYEDKQLTAEFTKDDMVYLRGYFDEQDIMFREERTNSHKTRSRKNAVTTTSALFNAVGK